MHQLTQATEVHECTHQAAASAMNVALSGMAAMLQSAARESSKPERALNRSICSCAGHPLLGEQHNVY